MASDYKKVGLNEDAKLLWKISSPGVFRAVDTNGDRFISKDELNKIAGFDGDENNLTYKDL